MKIIVGQNSLIANILGFLGIKAKRVYRPQVLVKSKGDMIKFYRGISLLNEMQRRSLAQAAKTDSTQEYYHEVFAKPKRMLQMWFDLNPQTHIAVSTELADKYNKLVILVFGRNFNDVLSQYADIEFLQPK